MKCVSGRDREQLAAPCNPGSRRGKTQSASSSGRSVQRNETPTEHRRKKEQALVSWERERTRNRQVSGASAKGPDRQNETPVPAGKASVGWNQSSN